MVQGETVPYIICVEKDSEGHVSANQKGLAERAHHPEEINAASNLAVDAEYYLTQQVHLRYTSKALATVCSKSVSCLHLSKDMDGACAAPRVCNVLLKPGGAKNQSPAHEHFKMCDSCPPSQAHTSYPYCRYGVRLVSHKVLS